VHTRGKDIAWALDANDPILGQRLHLRQLDDVAEFTIELTTSPQAKALQWLSPQQTAGGQHPFLYSQCQAIQARSIFPCQDSPSVRFTFDARVQVANPLVAVLAAEQTGVVEGGATRVFTFRMQQPIPSYLFAIVVGNLEFREFGPRTGIYGEPEGLDAHAWEYAENERKLDQAEGLLGPYLWDRYDIVIMPPSFPFGAMENPRLTFVSSIFTTGDRSQTTIISHELAHAWTGNLVTNATWEDFWLNEGWTVYAESRITEALEGVEHSQLLNAVRRLAMFEAMERFGMDCEHTCLKYSQEGIDPDEIFSIIPYIKGFSFLLQVERSVGREAFDRFLRKYIDTYNFRSLTTEGFVAFLKQELPEAVEQVDVERWLYDPGWPEDAPTLSSALYDDVAARVAEYEQSGTLPVRTQVEGWHLDQILLFLRLLPQTIPADHCRQLGQLFDLRPGSFATILTRFYVLSIRSGYQAVLPGVEQLVGSVGRSYVVRAIFRALVAEEWTRGLARPMWERYRERHHPITVANIESILSAAGL
jgi:aminopeptidase N